MTEWGGSPQPQRQEPAGYVLGMLPGWGHCVSGQKGFPAKAWPGDWSFIHKHLKSTTEYLLLHPTRGHRTELLAEQVGHTQVLAVEPEIWDLHVTPMVLFLSTKADHIRHDSSMSFSALFFAPALAGICPSLGGAHWVLPISQFCISHWLIYLSPTIPSIFL